MRRRLLTGSRRRLDCGGAAGAGLALGEPGLGDGAAAGGAAERLAGLLEGLTEQEDLDQVGDWILECGSGDELLSRVSSLPANRRE